MPSRAPFRGRLLLAIAVLMTVQAAFPASRTGSGGPAPRETAAGSPRQTLNFTATADAFVVDAYPDRNFGGNTSLVVGRDSAGGKHRTIVEFNLTVIPRYATIENATLRAGPASGGSPGTIGVYRVRAPWSEGGANGTAYGVSISVSEEANLARTREPVLVHLAVPGGIVTNAQADFRLFDASGNEVPSQVYNVTLSGGRVMSLDLAFASTIGGLETKTYVLWYGLIPLPPTPSYRTKSLTSAPLWTYPAAVKASPAVGDLDGDGTLEVVVGTTSGQVVALSWNGTTLRPIWTYTAPGAIVSTIRIADLTGDGTPEVLFENTKASPPFNNSLTALSRTGNYLWHFPLGGLPTGPFAVADTNGDGIAEIYTGAMISNSSFYAIQGSDGSMICKYTDGGSINSGYGFAVGDVVPEPSGPPAAEIAFTDTGGKIRVRNPDCSVASPGNLKPGVTQTYVAPAIANVSFDGYREILLGDAGGPSSREFFVSALNWSVLATSPPLPSDVLGGQIIGDLDRDGTPEVYFLTRDGALYRATLGLSLAPPGWRFPGISNWTAVSIPAVADLDRDGRAEIVYGTDASVVYAVSTLGAEVHRWAVGAPVVAAPVVADLDGDGTLEVVVASDNSTDSSRTAEVYAFGTGSLGHDARTPGYNNADTSLWLDGNSPDGRSLLRTSVGPPTALDPGVTWMTRNGITPWASPGIDMDLSPIDNATVVPGSDASWNLTSLVQSWVGGQAPNNGVALLAADETATWNVSFPSREGTPGPVLEVTFTADRTPRIVGTVPDQTKPEDSPPWTLDLISYAWDPDTPLTRLRWDLAGVNASLYQVLNRNVTGQHFLTFQPLSNQFGNNHVSLFLFDDEGNFAVQPLWINLTPVNDPPIFNPPGVLYVRYDTPYPFNFTEDMSDVDNPLDKLTLATDDSVHAPVTPPHWVTFLYDQSFKDRWVYVTLTVSDGQAAVSRVVAVLVTANYPPELLKLLPDVILLEHQTVRGVFDLDDYFRDRDQNAVYYSWGFTHVSITINQNNSVDIASTSNWWGWEFATFQAVDPLGAFVEDTINVTVKPVNDPPVLAPLPPLVVHYDSPYAFDLLPYLSDPDTPIDELRVGTSNPNNVTVQGRVLSLLFPQRLGALTAPYLVPLTVTVTDGLNSAFRSTSVSVGDDFPPILNRTLPDVTFPEDTQVVYPDARTFDLDDHFQDNDSAYIVYSSGNRNVQVTLHPDHTVDFSAPVNWSGGELVTFRATDDGSAFVEDSIYVLVIPVNDAPYIDPVPPQIRGGLGSWLLDLTPYIVDSDTNESLLVLSVDGNPHVRTAGLVLVFDYSRAPLSENITVIVSDGELTARRQIQVEVSGPNPVLPYLPWILAAVFLVAVFLANRFLRAIVEEVFVITRSGLLVAHLSRSLTPDKDRDTVSAMLTAVQAFVRDTFRDRDESVQVKAMDLGPYKMSITAGDSFYLAVLYRGVPGPRFHRRALAVVRDVEKGYGAKLEGWGGNVSEVQGIGPMIESVFKARPTGFSAGEAHPAETGGR